jgi:di/tricarboxylate transporter
MRGFSPSEFLIPLSFSSILGGCLTIIGTSTNLVINGLLISNDREPFGFVEPAYIGLPLGIVALLYISLVGPRTLPTNRGGLFREIRDFTREMVTEVEVLGTSPTLGKPTEMLLDKLGVNKDELIKIRRRTDAVDDDELARDEDGRQTPDSSGELTPRKKRRNSFRRERKNRSARVDRNYFSQARRQFWNMPITPSTSRDSTPCSSRSPSELNLQELSDINAASELGPDTVGLGSVSVAMAELTGNKDMPDAAAIGPAAVLPNQGNQPETMVDTPAGTSILDVPADSGVELTALSTATDPASILSLTALSTSTDPASIISGSAETTAKQSQGEVPTTNHGTGSQFVEDVSELDVFELLCIDYDDVEKTENEGIAALLEEVSVSMTDLKLDMTSTVSMSRGETVRQYRDIFPVPDDEIIKRGDILFVGSGSGMLMNKIDAEAMKGLKILDANVFDLAGFGSDLVEVVISNRNPFIGKSIASCNFANYYGGPVVAARHVGGGSSFGSTAEAGEGNATKTLMSQQEMGVLSAGDLVMMVVNEVTKKRLETDFSKDFFVISSVGNLPAKVEPWDYGGVALFFIMLVCLIFVPLDGVQICMVTMIVMIFGGWVPPQEAFQAMDFPLLALIGAALSFAVSVNTSGLAGYISDFVRNSGLPPTGGLFLTAVLTMVMTNVVTNNAAAALSVPIALSVADSLDCSHKPFVMAVLYAASVSFMTPIGYQTNTMVWGPGGYSFLDFMKIGVPLNLIYVSLACAILPLVFPF